MNQKEKKKYKVKFSEEVLDKYNDLPDKVVEEFEKIIKGFKEGTIDPTKLGTPIDWIELKIKLKCPKCKSNEVEWLLDKNSNEVTFNCLRCSEHFWMTKKEYEIAVKRNPDCIV
jgi:ribosomal protein L33